VVPVYQTALPMDKLTRLSEGRGPDKRSTRSLETLTRNMVELRVTAPRECRVSRMRSSVSCGNWGELIAHLASVGVQAVETSCLVSLFQGSEDTDIKGDPMSEQVPDDSG
jgi:hypothetical protein